MVERLALGIFPMANILAAGLVVLLTSRRGEGRRIGLTGFEAVGGVALGVSLVGVLLAPTPIHQGIGRVLDATGMRPGLLKAVAATLEMLLPQLGMGLLGARLARSYAARSAAMDRRAA